MVRTGSCFAQVPGMIDRYGFDRAVRERDAERGAKGFRCWDQFVAMLFCQPGSADSLREICGGLSTALGRMVHLGLREAPKRSTPAHANAHRPWQVYQAVFEQLPGRCQVPAGERRRPFRFKNPLRIPDATVIDLCPEVSDRARFRRTKGAIKPHLQLQDRGCLPCWALVTGGGYARSPRGAGTFLRSRYDCGHGPRLHRPHDVRPLDRAGRVVRDPDEE